VKREQESRSIEAGKPLALSVFPMGPLGEVEKHDCYQKVEYGSLDTLHTHRPKIYGKKDIVKPWQLG
jgi:hypothetical protein